jgi:very-short-patch-repair endonuclease
MRGVSEKLKNRSRRLRQKMTPSETKLWAALRDRRFVNMKFRRQQAIGPFIADFCCWEKKIILELDGDSHAGKEAYDAHRVKWLEASGWKVFRFWDAEIFESIDGVMQTIYSVCSAPPPHPASDTAARRPTPTGGADRGRPR